MKKEGNSNTVCIIGAGLVGTMLSIYLAQRGFKIDLFEKRPDIRKEHISGNRTIAMSISNRGIKALKRIGLADKILENTIPKHSRIVHKQNGGINRQKYGKDGNSINTVDRHFLNTVLLNKADATNKVRFFFDHQCIGIDHERGDVSFLNTKLKQSYDRNYKWIIGADGIFSDVRENLHKNNVIDCNFQTIEYGYRELLIPPSTDGDFQLDANAVHVWPRKNYILVGLPSIGGNFTCNLFFPAKGKMSLNEIKTNEQVIQLFKEKYPSVMPLMPNMVKDFFHNSASEISTVKCDKWNFKDKVLLIGDAAHAIVPFFAMGMNLGFEDCIIFDDLLTKYNNDLGKVFNEFGIVRKKDTDSLSDLSYQNFSEISSSPNPDYHKKWELERLIWNIFPAKWMPLYSMIAFSSLRYSEVVRRNEIQKHILKQVLENNGHFNMHNSNRKSNLNIKELKSFIINIDKMSELTVI